MIRTAFRHRVPLFTALALTALGTAFAASAALDALSSRDAAGGLRAALSRGIDVAVAQLGTNNGFLNDPRVAIPLPSALEKRSEERRVGKEWRSAGSPSHCDQQCRC